MINMVLTRELGEEGIGHYMSIMPIMFFIIVLASFELPISISKYVAETEKPYHWPMLKYAFRLTLWISICFSLIVFLLFPALPPLKSYHPSVTVLFVLLVPMISFSSIARGYLMGTQQMGKIAFANGFRKLVQLILLILLFNLFEFSPEMSVIAGLSSFIASEAVIVLYLLTVYVYQAQELKKHARFIQNSFDPAEFISCLCSNDNFAHFSFYDTCDSAVFNQICINGSRCFGGWSDRTVRSAFRSCDDDRLFSSVYRSCTVNDFDPNCIRSVC